MGLSGSKEKKDEVDDDTEELYAKIDVGDQMAMKNIFDDKILEILQEEEYDINYSWDNYRIIMMVLAVLSTIGTHFNGVGFPNDAHIVYLCITIFFTLNFVLVLFTLFVQRDIIYTVYSKQKLPSRPKYHIRTDLPRFEDSFKVTFEDVQTPTIHVEEKLYVGEYFDEDGYFDEIAFEKKFMSLVSKFEKQQKND